MRHYKKKVWVVNLGSGKAEVFYFDKPVTEAEAIRIVNET